MIFHLSNIDTPEFKGWKKVSSYEGMLSLTETENSVWLINASLNWNGIRLSSFHGFDVANHIRTKLKSFAPIIFYSTIPQKYFEKKSEKEIKYKILFGRGSAFIEAPFKEQELNKLADSISPLNNASLHDVSIASCNLKGIVIEKLKHDLKFEQGVEVVLKTIESVSPYLNDAQKQDIQLSTYLSILSDKVKQNDRAGFETERDLFIGRCQKYLTADNSEQEPTSTEIRHRVVVVDDEKNFLQYVIENLSDSFIVIPFDNAANAWDYLQTDDGLTVRAVVSDWRLYNGKYMQQMQGYELLEHTGKNGFRALFTLSMQADFLVHQIRNKMSVRFTMYKKDNLEEAGQWRAFKDLLEQQCTEMNQVIAAIPKKDSWLKPQRKGKPSYYEEYLEKRNSTEWESFENGISESSNLIWNDYYLKFLKDELDESLQDFSKRFGLPLNSIEAMLIARRICLALYFRQNLKPQNIYGEEIPRVNVFSIFRNKFFDEEVEVNRAEHGDEVADKGGKRYSVEEWTKKLLNGTATSLLNTELGFNLDEVVSFRGIFPEEKNWLNRNGIEFSLQQIFDEIEDDADNESEPTERDLKEIENSLRKGNSFIEDEETDNFD